MLLDPEQKIARPRQIYIGSTRRDYVPLNKRALTVRHALLVGGDRCSFVACGADAQNRRPCARRTARTRGGSTATRVGPPASGRSRSGRGRPGRRRSRRPASTSSRSSRRPASPYASSRSTRDAGRRHQDGQRHRDDPGQAPRPDRARHPLRHQAVPGVPVSRRERRGVVDGRGARARARAEEAQQNEYTIELLFLDGEEAVHRVARPRQHLRQPALRAARRSRRGRSPASRRSSCST